MCFFPLVLQWGKLLPDPSAPPPVLHLFFFRSFVVGELRKFRVNKSEISLFEYSNPPSENGFCFSVSETNIGRKFDAYVSSNYSVQFVFEEWDLRCKRYSLAGFRFVVYTKSSLVSDEPAVLGKNFNRMEIVLLENPFWFPYLNCQRR